jgi:hypothetical protein
MNMLTCHIGTDDRAVTSNSFPFSLSFLLFQLVKFVITRTALPLCLLTSTTSRVGGRAA